MHDPTEGGIATGLYEIALAGNIALEIDLDTIPVPDVARRLCEKFYLHPLGVIASGALLATAAPQHVHTILARWQELGWPGAVIGRVIGSGCDVTALQNGQPCPFPTFTADEITKLWM